MFQVLEGKRVLVVDDEPDVCRFIGYELAECHVDAAHDAEEARLRFRQGSYDLAILDVMGVDGFTLLEELGASVPCIILTARALTPSDLQRAIDGRAVLFLPKDQLGRLDEYVAKALATREPLWTWLFRRLDFRRWFGPRFEPPAEPGPAAESPESAGSGADPQWTR